MKTSTGIAIAACNMATAILAIVNTPELGVDRGIRSLVGLAAIIAGGSALVLMVRDDTFRLRVEEDPRSRALTEADTDFIRQINSINLSRDEVLEILRSVESTEGGDA